MATPIIEAKPELEKQSTDLVKTAHEVVAIADVEGYQAGVELGRALRAMRKGLEEWWSEPVSQAHSHWKALVARREGMISPVQIAIVKVDRLLAEYLRKEEEKRREQERIAAEAAKKAQEDEALKEAQHLSELGQHEEAAQVLEEAIQAPAIPVVVPSQVPKMAGVSSRGAWKFRITDATKIPREYLKVDEVKIGQIVRALKNHANIPGVQAYQDTTISMRS